MTDSEEGRGRDVEAGSDDDRPRLRDVDHAAPDGVSADGVFDRGTAERDARRANAETDADAEMEAARDGDPEGDR
jgi:hypothetical protein